MGVRLNVCMETPPLALALLDVFESAVHAMSKSSTRESSLIASPRQWLLDGKLPHPQFFFAQYLAWMVFCLDLSSLRSGLEVQHKNAQLRRKSLKRKAVMDEFCLHRTWKGTDLSTDGIWAPSQACRRPSAFARVFRSESAVWVDLVTGSRRELLALLLNLP